MKKFDLNDQRELDAALDMLFSLPDDPDDSDDEADVNAAQELSRLDNMAIQEYRDFGSEEPCNTDSALFSLSDLISEWPNSVIIKSNELELVEGEYDVEAPSSNNISDLGDASSSGVDIPDVVPSTSGDPSSSGVDIPNVAPSTSGDPSSSSISTSHVVPSTSADHQNSS